MSVNRLALEKSPYLLQHAYNPVDWFPWGKEAFGRAKMENKPIFLSVGYSTCHWCHVMERESFESESIAKLLNANFISIKVDREERPDVDTIYMTALQAMSGSGGWPMSLFLTPDLKPIFAGTYFPPVPANGRPSFGQLLVSVTEFWASRHNEIVASSIEITSKLQEQMDISFVPAPTLDISSTEEAAYRYFEESFDPVEGGFGSAPKFPRPVQFDFLFQYYNAFGNIHARDMALLTLRKMADGGMHDHLGGGFHRYSVDRYWRVSHFEKMLYDQAQLVNSYLDAWQISHDAFFRDVARDIIEYVLRDMTHPNGGFFSAEDADSEGEEGKFYVWPLDEIKQVLGDEADKFARYYGVTDDGNFEHGKNVLYVAEHDISSFPSLPSLKTKLFTIRERRIRPLRDDKVLTSWNGLMIAAVARAGDVLDEPRYIAAAIMAGNFMWTHLRPNGSLLHRWHDGDEHSSAEARFDASLDDYAFLIKGYLDLYEATFDNVWLDRAMELQNEQDENLYDETYGGYFTFRDTPDLILRPKTDYDGAEPSGNSVAVQNLFRLAIFAEDDSFKSRAEQSLHFFIAKNQNYPYAMPEMMGAAFWSLKSPTQIVFSGDNLYSMQRVIKDMYLPIAVKMRAETSIGSFAKSLSSVDGRATVYVCQNFACQLPVTEPDAFAKLLGPNPIEP